MILESQVLRNKVDMTYFMLRV